MNPHEKMSLLHHLEKIVEYIGEQATTTECGYCIFNDGGYCKKWESQVPLEAQKDGCEEFQFNPDSPPF